MFVIPSKTGLNARWNLGIGNKVITPIWETINQSQIEREI